MSSLWVALYPLIGSVTVNIFHVAVVYKLQRLLCKLPETFQISWRLKLPICFSRLIFSRILLYTESREHRNITTIIESLIKLISAKLKINNYRQGSFISSGRKAMKVPKGKFILFIIIVSNLISVTVYYPLFENTRSFYFHNFYVFKQTFWEVR